jgi:hypothetical protein
MKLRIKGNSLRLRLGPAEVEHLLADGRVEETIRFAADDSARLTYALELAEAGGELALHHRTGEVTVLLARDQAHRWASGGEVSIAGEVEVGSGHLQLLVEKDFACLDRDKDRDTGRDQERDDDTFPNPKAGAAC